MIRRIWRAFWDGYREGKHQVAVEEALQNLKNLQPRILAIVAKAEGKRHLQIVKNQTSNNQIKKLRNLKQWHM